MFRRKLIQLVKGKGYHYISGHPFCSYKSSVYYLQYLRIVSTHSTYSNLQQQHNHQLWTSQLLNQRHVHTSQPLAAVEEVKAPNFPDSVSSGDVKMIKKEGDAVAMDEVVLEIETDKTALPVMSPGNGTIVKMLVKEGQSVKAQQPLFTVDVTGVAPAKAAPAPAAAPAAPKPTAAPAAAPAPVVAAKATTPTKAAVTKVAKGPTGPTPAAQRLMDPTKTISGTRTEHPVPMNKMRKRIAERLKEAQNTTAMLTTFNECDMSNLMSYRKANLPGFLKKWGVKLSFMSPFLKASANALMDQPVVNAAIIGDQIIYNQIMNFRKVNMKAFEAKHKVKLTLMSPFLKATANALIDQPVINGFIEGDDIIYRDYVDISVAVATPRGLVVPVLRNVESMDYPQIELTIGAIAEKARNGKLTPADMQGGTFTISNGGVFGSLLSMPIINLPQSAILGMHAIFQRPVAINGKVEIRPMMYLALSYDHRLIDGREAVLFLRKIKAGVEDPTSILAGI